jgi:hypothetical protein
VGRTPEARAILLAAVAATVILVLFLAFGLVAGDGR